LLAEITQFISCGSVILLLRGRSKKVVFVILQPPKIFGEIRLAIIGP